MLLARYATVFRSRSHTTGSSGLELTEISWLNSCQFRTPEGELMLPLPFAMFINDLADRIKSSRLIFAGDILIYRKIHSTMRYEWDVCG